MLHTGLPQVYHPGYLGGYFEDMAPYHQPYESYALRLREQRVLAWNTTERHPAVAAAAAATPFPLDLSLKSASVTSVTSSTSGSVVPPLLGEETIEVDDEEDRRSREEIRSRYASSHQDTEEEEVVVDDVDSQRSFSSSGYATAYYPEQHRKHMLLSPVQPYLRTPMTPPSTPSPPQQQQQQQQQQHLHQQQQLCATPAKARKEAPSPGTTPVQQPKQQKPPRAKKKHVRKLKFDEETSSPVSGTVILSPDEVAISGDIDKFNIVVVTEEARAEMAKIENRLGPYQCKLCKQLYEDAFQLAQHRCRRIANVEYRCDDCHKLFNCPANLASHKRWHKIRPEQDKTSSPAATAGSGKRRPQESNNNNNVGVFAGEQELLAQKKPRLEPNNNAQEIA